MRRRRRGASRGGALAGGQPAAADEIAVYRASGPDAGLFDQYDNDGYSLAVAPAAGGSLELPFASAPARSRAAPPFPTRTPATGPSRPRPSATRSRATLAGDAATQAAAVERILAGVASAVRYDPDRARRQDPASVFATRRAHCVGYSELAVDLLRRAGIAARTVQGILRSKPGSDG